MSLYTHLLAHEQHGLVRVAYGYDQPLQEFFILVEKVEEAAQEFEEFDNDDGILFSISNVNTIRPLTKGKLLHSNEELAQVLEEYGAPEEYHTAMKLGIPF